MQPNNRQGSFITPQKGSNSFAGGSSLKEALQNRNAYGKTEAKPRTEYLEYLDQMEEVLNKNIQENVFPHWR